MLKIFDGQQDQADLKEVARHLDGMEAAIHGVLNEHPLGSLKQADGTAMTGLEEHLNTIMGPFMINVCGYVETYEGADDVGVYFRLFRNPEASGSMLVDESLLLFCTMRRPYRPDVPDSNSIFAAAFREMVGKFLIKASKIIPLFKQSAPPRPMPGMGMPPTCPNS